MEKTEIRYWPEGGIFSEYPTLNGKNHGLCKRFHESGKVALECNWLNGKREGKCFVFFEDGSLSAEMNYKDGIPNGFFKRFATKKGKKTLLLKDSFKNGSRNGVCCTFYLQ